MDSNKKKMLIAEDSYLRENLSECFQPDFSVFVVTYEAMAIAISKEKGPFDIAILDMIMPAEGKDASGDETGLRILDFLIKSGLCSKFIVLSVRWDIEDEVSNRRRDGIIIDFLLKSEVTRVDIESLPERVARILSS